MYPSFYEDVMLLETIWAQWGC